MPTSNASFVTGLTATALAAVGFLTYQAHATAPDKTHTGTVPAAVISKAPRDKQHPTALPPGTGKGERVVYSLDDNRVWLVEQADKVTRTFAVTPGTIDPAPGTYTVTSRSGEITGSDGTLIEHVVRFTGVDGLAIGFSAAVKKAPATAVPVTRTGGIRESREDGEAMWTFATIGVRVVVIH
ncbi:hypothetical protein ABZ896_06480 [Streptomyces sp. NPDC047072]|uniref:hypothetical protein n=1 Tax=Streptomyces sp. NPDC047072 TaxID=3154809 RepID=UPI0033E6D15D